MTEDPETTEATPKLATLRPRDTSAAKESSVRYSRLVDRLRWVLPVVVLIGLGLLLVWPMWHANTISAVMVDNVPNLMVENLNLTGVDERNQPYALTAERALQAVNKTNLVDLEKPKGELSLQNGAWMAAQANQGRLDQKTKRLWLGGQVEIFHDKGYRFVSEEMNVDLAKSTAWGEQPVVIQSDFGKIEGTGFRLLDGGKTLVINGPAKMKLDLPKLRRSDKQNINHSRAR